MSMLTRATRALPPSRRVPSPPTPPPTPPLPSPPPTSPPAECHDSPRAGGDLPDPLPLGLTGVVIDLPPAPDYALRFHGETAGQERDDRGTCTELYSHDPGEAWLHIAMTVLSALAVLFGATALWLEVS